MQKTTRRGLFGLIGGIAAMITAQRAKASVIYNGDPITPVTVVPLDEYANNFEQWKAITHDTLWDHIEEINSVLLQSRRIHK